MTQLLTHEESKYLHGPDLFLPLFPIDVIIINVLRSTPVNPLGSVLSWLTLCRSNPIFNYPKSIMNPFSACFSVDCDIQNGKGEVSASTLIKQKAVFYHEH